VSGELGTEQGETACGGDELLVVRVAQLTCQNRDAQSTLPGSDLAITCCR